MMMSKPQMAASSRPRGVVFVAMCLSASALWCALCYTCAHCRTVLSAASAIGPDAEVAAALHDRLQVVLAVCLVLLCACPCAMHVWLPWYGTRVAMPRAVTHAHAGRSSSSTTTAITATKQARGAVGATVGEVDAQQLQRFVARGWSVRVDWLLRVWPPLALCALSAGMGLVVVVGLARATAAASAFLSETGTSDGERAATYVWWCALAVFVTSARVLLGESRGPRGSSKTASSATAPITVEH